MEYSCFKILRNQLKLTEAALENQLNQLKIRLKQLTSQLKQLKQLKQQLKQLPARSAGSCFLLYFTQFQLF